MQRLEVKNKVIKRVEYTFGFLKDYLAFFSHLKTTATAVTQNQIQSFFKLFNCRTDIGALHT